MTKDGNATIDDGYGVINDGADTDEDASVIVVYYDSLLGVERGCETGSSPHTGGT